MTNISRRNLLSLGVVAASSQILLQSSWAAPEPPAFSGLQFLRLGFTTFGGVDSLKGEDLIKARLTPESTTRQRVVVREAWLFVGAPLAGA